jgi:hypothetical protein
MLRPPLSAEIAASGFAQHAYAVLPLHSRQARQSNAVFSRDVTIGSYRLSDAEEFTGFAARFGHNRDARESKFKEGDSCSSAPEVTTDGYKPDCR